MSASFTTTLRSMRPPIELAPAGSGTLTFRVQAEELWDAVRVTAAKDTPVGEVKARAVGAFHADQEYQDDFVLKLHGWEMLDESASIGESGVKPGSIILLGRRRRIPVR